MAQGNHAQPFGVNLEGLKRRGFDKPTMHAIRNVYKMITAVVKPLKKYCLKLNKLHKLNLQLVSLWSSSNVLLVALFVN